MVIQCVQDESSGGFSRATRLRVQANSTITTGNACSYVSETGQPTETTKYSSS